MLLQVVEGEEVVDLMQRALEGIVYVRTVGIPFLTKLGYHVLNKSAPNAALE